MKNKSIGQILHVCLLFLLCILGAQLGSQTIRAQILSKLLPVKIEGKWGFADVQGKVVVEPKFAFVRKFSGGFAAIWTVSSPHKCGYLDANGIILIKTKFDDCGSFSEGLAVIKINDKYGFVSNDGKDKILPNWQYAGAFSGGFARVATETREGLKYGFINRKGQVVIAPAFAYANDFKDGVALAAVAIHKGLKIGFINTQGRWLIRPHFGTATNFSEGLACVASEGSSYVFEGILSFDSMNKDPKGFYIDKSGKRAFPKSFQHCSGFSEGLAPVEVNGLWSYINKQGKTEFTTIFTSSAEASPFSEGMAAINFAGGAKFINNNGTIAIDTKYDYAQNFEDGIAQVKNVGADGAESYGYIDRKGKVIWKPSK